MKLPQRVKDYLDARGFPYRLVSHAQTETLRQTAEAVRIPPDRLLRAMVLQDSRGPLMAILPSNHILDFSLLCQGQERDLEPVSGPESFAFFKGCDAGTRPPLPALFGLPALVEESLAEVEGELYFDTGRHGVLACMTGKDFRGLLGDIQWAHFAPPLDTLTRLQQSATTPEHITEVTHRYTPVQIREGLESIKELPPLPDGARRMVALLENPGIDDLMEIVEADAHLTDRTMLWAQSGFYSQGHPVESPRAAVGQVLGADTTLALLLATSISRGFRIPPDGPLGLKAYWRHSLYCAILVGELVKIVPADVCPRPGMAYLGGLLHRFGYPLLGNLFPAQFFLLNRFLVVNTHLPSRLVDRYVLGVEHEVIGAWLMEAWGMPQELIAALRWHRQEDYSQPYSEYANLVLIANRLLHRLGIGDESTERLPAHILASLGLGEESALACLERVRQQGIAVDELARILST